MKKTIRHTLSSSISFFLLLRTWFFFEWDPEGVSTCRDWTVSPVFCALVDLGKVPTENWTEDCKFDLGKVPKLWWSRTLGTPQGVSFWCFDAGGPLWRLALFDRSPYSGRGNWWWMWWWMWPKLPTSGSPDLQTSEFNNISPQMLFGIPFSMIVFELLLSVPRLPLPSKWWWWWCRFNRFLSRW